MSNNDHFWSTALHVWWHIPYGIAFLSRQGTIFSRICGYFKFQTLKNRSVTTVHPTISATPWADRFKKLHSQDVRQMLCIYLTKTPKMICRLNNPFAAAFHAQTTVFSRFPFQLNALCTVYIQYIYLFLICIIISIIFKPLIISHWKRQLWRLDTSFHIRAAIGQGCLGSFWLANKASFIDFIVPWSWNPSKRENSEKHPRDPC